MAYQLPRVTLVLALSLAGIVRAQDTNKPITYTTVAVPLRQAVAEMARQTGTKLFVDDKLADEPIILRLQGVPAGEAMSKIAEVVGAEWLTQGKETTLVRTAKIEEQLKQRAFEDRASQIAKGIKELQPSASMPYAKVAEAYTGMVKLQAQTGDYGYANFQKLSPQFPETRALAAILTSIDPKALAAIPMGGSAVFSNQPNSAQGTIAFDVSAIGERLQAEQNTLAELLEKGLRPEERLPLNIVAANPYKRMATTPTRFVIRFNSLDYLIGGLNVKMLVFDKDNKPLTMAGLTINVNDFGKPDLMAAWNTANEQAKGEESIPLSPESRAQIDHLKHIYTAGGDAQPFPPSLREFMLNPEEHDPLSGPVSEAFIHLAERRSANAIVYLGDVELGAVILAAIGRELKESTFLKALEMERQGSLAMEGGWVTYAPVDRIAAWTSRTDRHAFGECVREADQKGYVSLEKAAALAETERGEGSNFLLSFCSMFYGRFYDPYYQRDKLTLRFYESLDPNQKAALLDGLKASMLRKDQWIRLQRIAEVADGGITISYPPGAYDEGDLNNHTLSAALREPSESMPGGVPQSATVTMKATDGPTYFAGMRAKSGAEYVNNTDLSGIAYWMAEAELSEENEPYSEVVWLAPGHSRKLAFHFKFTDRIGMTRELEEASRDGAEQWPIDKLPAKIKAELEEHLVERRRQIQSWKRPKPAPKPPL